MRQPLLGVTRLVEPTVPTSQMPSTSYVFETRGPLMRMFQPCHSVASPLSCFVYPAAHY